jgi:L-2-hydroxyglutarate oxidase LhgO
MSLSIEEVKRKEKKLRSNIRKMLEDFCEETGMRFKEENKITAHYDVEERKGLYNIWLDLRNPF